MIILDKAKAEIKPGTWKHVDGRTVIQCPKCAHQMSFTEKTHAVTPSGFVPRAIKCPRKCGFEDTLILNGWGK